MNIKNYSIKSDYKTSEILPRAHPGEDVHVFGAVVSFVLSQDVVDCATKFLSGYIGATLVGDLLMVDAKKLRKCTSSVGFLQFEDLIISHQHYCGYKHCYVQWIWNTLRVGRDPVRSEGVPLRAVSLVGQDRLDFESLDLPSSPPALVRQHACVWHETCEICESALGFEEWIPMKEDVKLHNSVVIKKTQARRSRKNAERKRWLDNSYQRKLQLSLDRLLKEERRSEDFFASFHGQNDIGAIRNKEPRFFTQGFEESFNSFSSFKPVYIQKLQDIFDGFAIKYEPSDGGREWNDVKYVDYSDYDRHLLFLNMDCLHLSAYKDRESAWLDTFKNVTSVQTWRETLSFYVDYIVSLLPVDRIKEKIDAIKGVVFDFLAYIDFVRICEKVKNCASAIVDFLKKHILQTIVLIISVIYARCTRDICLAFFAFALVSGIDYYADDIVSAIASSVSLFESEGFGDTINLFRSLIERVYSSSFVGALKNLIVLGISTRWFPKATRKTVELIVGKSEKMSLIETICSALSSISSLFKYGELLLEGKPFNEIIMASDPISAFLNETRDHLARSQFVYDGLPITKDNECLQGWKCRKEYMQKIEFELLPTGRLLKKESGLFSDKKKAIEKALFELENELMTHKATQRRRNRLPPIGIIVHGPSKIGKSHVVKLFPAVYSAVKGREFDESQIFNKPKTSDYWDGYSCYLHHYVFISELANESEVMVMKSQKNDLTTMQSLVDGLPFVCDMSAVDDKGKTWFDSDMVIADTNVPHLHAYKLSAFPAAQYRRYMFVGLSVKTEFRSWVGNIETTSLDAAKSLGAGGNLLDRYDFVVTQYEALNRTPLAKVVFRGDVSGLVKFLIPVFKTHIRNNEAVRDADLYSFVKDIYKESCADSIQTVKVRDIYSEAYPFSRIMDPDLAEEKDFNPEVDLSVQGDVCAVTEGADGAWRKLNGLPQEPNLFKFCLNEIRYLAMKTAEILFIWMFALFLDYDVLIRNFVESWFFYVVSIIFLFVTRFHFIVVVLLIFIKIVGSLPRVVIKYVGIETREKLSLKKDLTVVKYWKVLGLGKQDFSWLLNKDSLQMVALVTSMSANIILAVKMYKSMKKDVVLEGNHTIFRNESVLNEEILSYEEKMECSNEGRVRIKTHDKAHYNVLVSQPDMANYQGLPRDLHGVVATNIRLVEIYDNDSDYSTRAYVFGVKGHYAVTTSHLVKSLKSFVIEIASDNHFTKDTRSYTLQMTQKFVRYLDQELCVVFLDQIVFRDITQHLIDGSTLPLLSGFLRDSKVNVSMEKSVEVFNQRLGEIPLENVFTYKYDHFPGLCGYPIICLTNRHASAVVALHCAGDKLSKTSFAVPLRKTAVLGAIEALKLDVPYMEICSQGLIDLPLRLPVVKSPFYYEHLPFLTYSGRIEGPIMLPDKSKLELAPFSSVTSKLLFDEFKFVPTVHYGKPMFKPRFVDGIFCSPYNKALLKMNASAPTPNYNVLKIAIDRYVRRIVEGLRSKGVEKLGPITIQQAINGVEDDPFVSRINMSTSAAFGFTGSKSKYFPIVQDDPLIREPDEVIKKGIADVFRTYLRDEMCHPIFKTQLKDEPRELEKCANGATRVFYMSPQVCLVVSRSLLAPFYSRMVEFPDVFGVAIGYDMHKVSGNLCYDLSSWSECILEFDYAGFDVANPLFIAKGASTVIYKVLEEMGYSSFSLRMLKGVLSDSVFPMVSMNQDLFCKGGLQPSGKYGTAEDNSIRGVLMLLYAWYHNPHLADKDFFDYVKPIVYGDDALVSVKSEVIDHYNNITYKRFCEVHYLMKVTPASKSGEFAPFLNIFDVSFLKRRFVKHFTGNIVGRLDMNSINKSFQWIMPSAIVTRQMQVHSAFQSMLWELFFHCVSEEQYVNIRKKLLAVLVEYYGGEESHYPLPSFSNIYNTVFDENGPAGL